MKKRDRIIAEHKKGEEASLFAKLALYTEAELEAEEQDIPPTPIDCVQGPVEWAHDGLPYKKSDGSYWQKRIGTRPILQEPKWGGAACSTETIHDEILVAPAPTSPSTFPQYQLDDSGLYGPTRLDWNQELQTRWPVALIDKTNYYGNWVDANGVAQGTVPFASIAVTPTTRGYIKIGIMPLVERWQTTKRHKGIYLYSRASISNGAFADIQGRQHDNPPRLVVTTTTSTFILPGTLAGYHISGTNGLDTRLQFRLSRASVGLLQFPIEEITGSVITATLEFYVMNSSNPEPLTIQIMETDPPFMQLGGDGGSVELGLAHEVGGMAGLIGHPDVIQAGDFRKENWISHMDGSIMRATKLKPSPLGTYNEIPTDIPGYEVEWPVQPDGSVAIRASFVPAAPGFIPSRAVAGINFRGEFTEADTTDPMFPIGAGGIEEMFVSADMLLEEDFWSTTDGIKAGLGFDCRWGYWVKALGGYWQPVSGNSGTPGTGLRVNSARAPGQWEYQGHSIRQHFGNCRPSGTVYQKYRPLLTMVSHNGPFNYTTPYGTEEILRCGTAVIKKGRWHRNEWRMKMNSISGPFDSRGNGFANRDGILVLYLDGVKVWEKTDFAWRRHPHIGIMGFWNAWYHGGTKPPAAGEILHYQLNNFVCSRRYIGPLKLAA